MIVHEPDPEAPERRATSNLSARVRTFAASAHNVIVALIGGLVVSTFLQLFGYHLAATFTTEVFLIAGLVLLVLNDREERKAAASLLADQERVLAASARLQETIAAHPVGGER